MTVTVAHCYDFGSKLHCMITSQNIRLYTLWIKYLECVCVIVINGLYVSVKLDSLSCYCKVMLPGTQIISLIKTEKYNSVVQCLTKLLNLHSKLSPPKTLQFQQIDF